ncbi:hypothetical protein ACOMHN_026926 [Nucella lapillus]
MRSVFCHIPVRAHNSTTVGMVHACMAAVEDGDFHVRMLFAQEVGCLSSPPGPLENGEDPMTSTDQTIFDQCKAASVKASASSDPQLHETVLITVGQLASYLLVTSVKASASSDPQLHETVLITVGQLASYLLVTSVKASASSDPQLHETVLITVGQLASYLLDSYLFDSYLLDSYLLDSYLFDSYLFDSYLFDSYLFDSYLLDSYLFNSYLFDSYLLDSYLLDSYLFDSYLLDSYLLDSYLLDSYQLDSYLLDSYLLDSYLFDSYLLDSYLLDSYLLDSYQFDSYLLDSYLFDSYLFDSYLFDSYLLDSYLLDSYLLDSYLLDSYLFDSYLLDSYLFDSYLFDSYLFDSYLLDSYLLDSYLLDSYLLDSYLLDSYLFDSYLFDSYLLDSYLLDSYLLDSYLLDSYLFDSYLFDSYLFDSYLLDSYLLDSYLLDSYLLDSYLRAEGQLLLSTLIMLLENRLSFMMMMMMMMMMLLFRRAEGQLLLSTLIMLLENRLSFTPLVAPVAYDELQRIAVHKQITPQKLFSRFKPALCKFLVEAMLEAQTTAGRSNAESILQTVANTLGYPDLKSFLQSHIKHLLPPLVSRASSEASSLIRLLSNLLSMPNRRKLITNNIKDIFSFLVCHCQKSDLEKTLVYLQKETDFELGSLLRMDFQRVHNELLLRLSVYENQVFSGLQMVSLYDEQYEGTKDIQTKEQMAAYLEPRLLGVLAFFDATLVNSNIPIADKKLALESLISIVLLMGSKHISSIRHKVVNTLRLGLQFKDRSLMEVSCRAWNCFVRSLELPLLGQMLFQIVATLLPLLLQMPRQVSDIINYMVVDNGAALQKHFHEIYFLPDLPELADAAAVLKHYTDDPSSQADPKTQLMNCIKGANHESLDVRTHALSRLRRLLREKKDSIYALILGSESAEPVISQLVSVLLHGCQEAEGHLQCVYGQCLGELGALDPGRLQLMSNDPREQHARFQATVEDDNFVVGLITEIIKAFLAATKPRVQDCSAFALQELLQIYHIEAPSGTDSETRGNKLWRRLSENQEILAPLLNTKYKLTAEKSSSLPVPIYGSSKGKNLLDWVSNWTNFLVSKVKQGLAFQVFQACSATKRHSLQVSLYLLPHIVLQVLLDGTSQDHLEIYKEVMEVVGEAKKAGTRHTSTSDLRHMSAQTVFSVLDYLTKWRTHRIRTLTAGLPAGRVPTYANDGQFRAVNGFMVRIPQDVLAEASYNCKAYTRALMHFEEFIVDTKQDLHDIGHLDFLQRLYDCLNEADGVIGVAAVRQTQPTLTQEILVHESLGHQQDGQACYERALQVCQRELWPHQGFVCSLMEMGQLNMALIHTTGILANKSVLPHA